MFHAKQVTIHAPGHNILGELTTWSWLQIRGIPWNTEHVRLWHELLHGYRNISQKYSCCEYAVYPTEIKCCGCGMGQWQQCDDCRRIDCLTVKDYPVGCTDAAAWEEAIHENEDKKALCC